MKSRLTIHRGIPYLFYIDTDYKLQVKKYVDGSWQSAGTVSNEANDFCIVSDDSGIYILYSVAEGASLSYTLKKHNGSNISQIRKGLDDEREVYYANPDMVKSGDDIYLVLRDYYQNKLVAKQITGSTISDLGAGASAKSSPKLIEKDGKVYVGVSSNIESEAYHVWQYDGSSWSKVGESLESHSVINHDIAMWGDKVCVVLDNPSGGKTKFFAYEVAEGSTEGAWVQKGSNVENSVDDLALEIMGDYAYIGYLEKEGEASYPRVKYKNLNGVTEQAPSVSTVTGVKMVSNSLSTIRISWTKQDDIYGYYVYRATSANGTYSFIKTITGSDTNYFVDSGKPAGKTYYYKVKAYKKLGGVAHAGTYSSAAVSTTLPAKGYMSLKAGRSKIKVSWRGVAGATGYQVYRATKRSGKYKKVKTLSAGKRYWKNSGRVKGKKYYYKIRAYKTVGGKTYYGSFSKIKYKKTKR